MRKGGSGRSVRTKREASRAEAKKYGVEVINNVGRSATIKRTAGGQEYTHKVKTWRAPRKPSDSR